MELCQVHRHTGGGGISRGGGLHGVRGTRPRVEKQGSHGLFTTTGEPVVLAQVASELDDHRGPVWTLIVSLRREDAQRLGYDSASRWRDLLRAQTGKLAEGLKIAPSHLNGTQHSTNEGHHPHVHLISYSTKPGEGFLTKQGMEKIRSALAQEIFRQDLISVYQQETTHGMSCGGPAGRKLPALFSRSSAGSVKTHSWNRCCRIWLSGLPK